MHTDLPPTAAPPQDTPRKRPLRSTPHSLIEADAAAYLGCSRAFLRQSRRTTPKAPAISGPAFIRLGRSIRYRLADLDAWLDAHRVHPRELKTGTR